MIEERREVDCLRASLSEHDFERVCGASGREGLPLTCPRAEKYSRPRRRDCWLGDAEGTVMLASAGVSHGVESSWAAIVSSILASPPQSVSANFYEHGFVD